MDATLFIRMVLPKLAATVFFHTFRAHIKKYTMIGSIQVASTKNLFHSSSEKKW